MDLFGFEIKRANNAVKPLPSFVADDRIDGSMVVEGGIQGSYLDLDGVVRNETELVNQYREMTLAQEIDQALDDIVNEAIVGEAGVKVVEINLENLKQPDRVKNIIRDEFQTILELYDFKHNGYDIFRRWYVDGRLPYHITVDPKDTKAGIKELRYIDSRKIRKVREIKKNKTENNVIVQEIKSEYYIYNEAGFIKTIPGIGRSGTASGIKIAKDSIIYCTSGLTNPDGDQTYSYLHKAIKPLNQLKSLEDSLVIYRISRAPERRIFYIDVGNLPKIKAEQYLRDIMTRFKNKVVYDSKTGQIRDDRKHMTMLEDFWLPRREGSRGTEISTLAGGQNLGQIEDVVYFQQNLFKSLNVPITRLLPETQFSVGRSAEISRDEIKFSKFIDRLRSRFSFIFTEALKVQLILKGTVTLEEWPEFATAITYDYGQDNYFAELKETEILRDRISMLRDLDDAVGKYYSISWVRKNVLRQSEEDIQDIDREIEEDKKKYGEPMEQQTPQPDQQPTAQPSEPPK